MKRILLADDNGRILASAPAADDLAAVGLHFGYRPMRGQHLHTIELPAHIQTLQDLQELHKTHSVEMGEGVSRLIRA